MRKSRTKSLLLSLSLLVVTNSFGQLQAGGGGNAGIGNTGVTMIGAGPAPELVGSTSIQTYYTFSARGGLRLPPMNDVEGSPFLHAGYNTAFVRLKSGYTATVPVKYNMYGNEIIFMQNNNELAMDSVAYVSYMVLEPHPGRIVLQSGYPPLGTNTRNTIYQVLDSGAIQLLKHTTQTIEEVRTMGTVPKKEFVTKEELYIYTPGGELKKIKADKKSLQEALPQYAEKIERIIEEKKLKLKKEADIRTLISELNLLKPF